jgi:hypothetical protein
MARSVRLFGAALIVAALISSAQAQTTQAAATASPTLHARAKHHKKLEPAGRQITVHRRGSGGTPSWLTLGTGAPEGTGNNYVTSTFDQPPPIDNTFTGSRGRMGLSNDNRFDGPGIPLIRF